LAFSASYSASESTPFALRSASLEIWFALVAPAEANDGELAPGDQLVGEGRGDPQQLAGFGDGVDEAIVGCLWCED
jgi:hypothetical protein